MQEAEALDKEYRDLLLTKKDADNQLKHIEKLIIDFASKHPDYKFKYAIPVQPSIGVDWKKLEKIFELEGLDIPLVIEYDVDIDKAIEKLKNLDEEIPKKKKISIDRNKMEEIAKQQGIEIPTRTSRRGYVREKKEKPKTVF